MAQDRQEESKILNLMNLSLQGQMNDILSNEGINGGDSRITDYNLRYLLENR